jgi:ABC-2 type transport system permease protein
MNLKHILLLLKLKLLILINGFIKGASKKRIRKLIAVAGGGFLFFFIYKWIFDIFATLDNISVLGAGLIDNSIVMIFLGFFIFLLASGITVSIHYLFISSDLPLLMVSPLSNNTIFIFKLIEAVFANSTFFFFMGIPIFIAYGFIAQAHWYYYPLMIINVLFFLTIPISIAFLGALLIVRIIPPQRARELMAILLGVVSLGIWLVLQIVRASMFDQNSPDFNPQTMTSLQQISQNFLFNLLPSTWAARSLAGFAHSDFRLIVFNFLPLLIFVICIFTICIQLSKNAFKQGFISSEQSLTLKRKKKNQRSRVSDLKDIQSFFSGVSGSIFVRDFKLLFRDTRQLVNILLFAVIMVILPLLQKQKGLDSEFSAYYPYVFIIFFSPIISGQISSRLIPIEAKSFWITKLIPQSPMRIILGKFMLGFSLSIILIWTAVTIVSIYFHNPIRIVILALIATLCFTSAFSSLGLLIGTYFSRFDWDHPKRMLSTTGGLLLSLSAFLIGGLVIAIFVIGYQFQLSLDFLSILVISIIFLLSLIILLLSNLGATKKLEKMEWKF